MEPLVISLTRRHLLSTAGAAVLAGCSADPVPKDRYFRLTTSTPPAAAGPVLPGTIEVPPFRAEGVVAERALLYRKGPNRAEQYSYDHWEQPPSVMVQQAFIDMLRRSGAFGTVVPPEMRLNRDYELLGRIRRMEHVLAAGAILLELELGVRQIRSGGTLLLKTYTAEEPAPGGGVDGAVNGFSRALESIFGQFLTDLAAAPKA